ncbi:MerR family transcriptional regulator [Cellulomonas fimi]|uniref:MerR family transcriptional regulator n=1 Tax=Cellulomonas fimi TaxID=1708 RepID=UPI00234D7DD2|nr:MerR family transcriptional regulator [Cellulomonas fimi]MDC7121671.1 MerR family transcriptional regulator [Cellulomonas fimi]
MYTIGEFAGIGRVSVRMLRHYDAIGLLRPAHVDDRTGYRRYAPAQVPHLLRLVELRDLGVGLDRIATVLSADDEHAAFAEVLRERLREIESELAAEAARADRIRRKLSQLEGDAQMSVAVDYRSLPSVTVYALAGVAPGMGPEHVSPVVGPLIERLDTALEAAGRAILEPSTFWYEPHDDDTLGVTVSYPAGPDPQPGDGYHVVDLPSVPLAAIALHHGDMSGIGESWMALFEQLTADGYRVAGPTREVYLEAEGHEPGPDWVTELQAPVERVA